MMQLYDLLNSFCAETDLKKRIVNDLIFFFKDVMLDNLFFTFIS